MLRVGLTGGLGSGKSTVGRIFSELGAHVISADEIGRRLMQPGEKVYAEIVREFGDSILCKDGSLNRRALAELSFQKNQAAILNRIVHPATVAAEQEWVRDLFAKESSAIAIVESALIFEVQQWGTAPGWADYFDKLVLVTAPDTIKIARFVARAMIASPSEDGKNADRAASLERDARARLAMQIPDEEKARRCDYVIHNTGTIEETRRMVEGVYRELQAANRG